MHKIKPVEYKVLVKPIEVEKKTKGGIILPDETHDREQFAQQEGVLVAVSDDAFTNPTWLNPPKVGDTVLYDKYSGCTVTGRDGVKYRLINDRELGGIIRE